MKLPINRKVSVLGTGSYVPDRVITNPELEGMIVGYDEEKSGDFSTWVDRVTHIHERRYIEDGENAATMATEASQRALDMAGVRPDELDLIVHCSFTPSQILPGDHVLNAQALGAVATPSFALTSACAGSVHGMAMAYGMIGSGAMDKVLVVGTETISPTLDYADPLTAILFADGAGAVVMGAGENERGGTLTPWLGFDFNLENITMNNPNLPFSSTVRTPATGAEAPAVDKEFLRMRSGPSILRNAVNTMARCAHRVLGFQNGVSSQDPELRETLEQVKLVPHQANGRIVDGLAKKLGLGAENVTKTVHRVGNVSAASNLIALDFAMRRGNMHADTDPETGKIREVRTVEKPLQRGDLVVLTTIGAGYLYGGIGFINTMS